MIYIYGIKNCDSVKKALLFLNKHALEHTFHDYKTQELPCSKIEEWLTLTDTKTLFNAKSTTYRELKLKELNLDEKGLQEWLCKENRLIKRPVVEYKGELFVGFNEENYTRSFL
jgi:Spx/MgsR family transcriptional regulator